MSEWVCKCVHACVCSYVRARVLDPCVVFVMCVRACVFVPFVSVCA